MRLADIFLGGPHLILDHFYCRVETAGIRIARNGNGLADLQRCRQWPATKGTGIGSGRSNTGLKATLDCRKEYE